MFTTQDKFLAFVRHLESANEEELDQALTLIQEEPKIATMFADKSPKFVEIFSHLQQGNVQTRIAVRYYRIISVLFDILTPNYQIYFRSLNYLSDTIIRRHMASMLILMKNKKGKDALHLIYQAAKVNTAHCRDLFTAIDFSNYIIKEQAKTDARPQLIQLISLFLQTPEISPSLLSTKYSVSGIWKDLIKDPNDVARLFLDSMIVATAKLNYSTKRWVFNDMTLKTLSSYPLDHRKSSVSPHFSAFQLLKSVLTGENSINTEEPQRVYCRNYQSIEPPPKNNFILFFIRELNPWRLMSHCELVISIFEDSPDLIGTYLSTCGKKLQPDVNLTTLSSIRFLGKIIELDWPAFLSNETNFFDDGHSLDLLFESILPSMIQTSVIIQFLKHESLIVRRGMLLLLNKAVNKFLKLPEALKRSSLYTKFGGRLTTTISQNIINTSKFESLFPFALKFFISMNQVFPFFVSDTFSKDPPFLNEIQSFPPYIQHLILQFIPLLSKPIPKIPLLCSIVTDDRFSKPIQRESLEIVKLIIRNTEIMNGFESEIPIFVSEALQNNASNNLFELINLTKGSLLKYSQHVGFSPMYNALQPENPLYNSKLIIDVMNGNVPNDIILEPSEIMKNIKWYSLEAITILLCASLHNNLQIGINCLTIVTCSSPERTLPYVLENVFIKDNLFKGNNLFDETIAKFIQWNNGCNDIISRCFIEENIINENVIDIITPFIPKIYTKQLIHKLLNINHSIRNVIIDNNKEYDLETLNEFWKWAFKGFIPIDLTLLDEEITPKIDDELLLLDILRTIWLTKDITLLPYLNIQSVTNSRLFIFATEIIPGRFNNNIEISSSLALCYYLKRNVNDPLHMFKKTHKKWCYEFLLQQIRNSHQVSDEITRVSKDKLNALVDFYIRNPSNNLEIVFNRLLTKYLIKHPEKVIIPIQIKSEFLTNVAQQIIEPSQLIEYTNEQIEGVINILFGANINITIRLILYLSTCVTTSSSSFFKFLETIHFPPSGIYFVTGDVSKVVIQILDSKQNVNIVGLCRNASYLAPFHEAQQHIEIDTPFFRFLLQFAHFLLTNAEIPIEIMLERGVLSVLFHALSSKDDHTRAISYHSLSQLYDYNHKKKGWKFENQIAILLESVLNAVTEPNKRFTSIITHFLSAATTIIMKPNHPLFMPVVKFIASNPSLKRSSVPMFNELFGQSTLDYRVGRMWILKFLRNGINESSDVLLMKKGRIIERLCSFFSSSLSDSTTRSNVLEIFINASKQIKIDGLIFWVYSIITEQFALMHYNQLIELALLTKQKTEIEKECLKRLIDIVMKEHPELIEEETLAKLKNLIGSETLNIE